jgi:hypothetical protein
MKIYAPGDEHDDMGDSLCLAVGAMTGKRFVERQSRIYSAGGSSSVDQYEGEVGSYTIGR